MPFPIIPGGSPLSSGYQISRSLRFRSSASAYLSRTFSTSRTLNTKGTFSVWVKRGALGADSFIFGGYDGSSTGATALQFKTDNTLMFDFGGSAANSTTTTQVFRDVGAFYHIVLAIDTTSATTTITGSSTDRVRLYVNGTQVSAFSGTSVPTQNSTWMFALNTANNKIGTVWNNTGGFFDGYLAEVNFIDGQALTPSSFGAYDTTTGVWQPARYTGSYGNNGFYLPFTLNSTSTYAGSFNGTSKYLSVSSLAPNWSTYGNWTAEAWINVSSFSPDPQMVFGTGGSDSIGYVYANGSIGFGISGVNEFTSATGLVSAGQWYHIAWVRNGTAINIYLNGVSVASTSSASTYLSNTNNALKIGFTSSTYYFNGSISNFRFNNTAVYTSAFTPSSTALTAISGTQLLTLQNSTIIDNSSNSYTITNNGSLTTATATPFAANISSDASGNNNGWISRNINYTSSGTTYDSMIDSPTNYADGGNGRGNYATWNPVNKNATVAVTDGNLSANSGAPAAAHRMIFGSQGFTTPSYFEITTSGGTTSMVSIVGVGQNTTGTADGVYVGSYSKSFGLGYAIHATNWYANGATNANGAATNLVDGTWGFAVDPANGKGWVRNTSGNWIGGGNPAAGTLPTFTWTSDGLPWFPIMSFYNVATTFVGILNAGQRSYAFTAPSGFLALNTQNLPTPTIANGAQNMAATTYIGTSASNPISNGSNNTLGTTFQPDFVWIKNRNYASGTNHVLIDSVRGISNGLASNLTNGDFSTTGNFSSINPTGFTVAGTARDYNFLNDTFVGWQWKAGGTPTVNNTAGAGNVPTAGSVLINGANSTSALAGSIAATRLSANQSAGFSVVTYTGTGNNVTIGHGLGVAPSLIIAKSRSVTDNWLIYHASLGNTKYLDFTTAAAGTASTAWNNTSPTPTDFSLGTAPRVNTASSTNVAYCFANVSGYSSAFSYTGNGSSDGPMVFLNFRPRWILAKRTDTTGDWWIIDTSRDTYNVSQNGLNPNLSNAESTGWYVDVLSNGFKIRVAGTGTSMNASGGTYIGYAIAENPFRISRAR